MTQEIKIDVFAVLGPDVIQRHVFSPDIAGVLHVLEETNCARVFKPDAFIRLQQSAVEEAKLGFTKNRPGDVSMKRPSQKDDVQAFQNRYVLLHRIERNLEIPR